MIDEKYITKLSSFFKAISENNRVKIIYSLSEGEKCVGDITEIIGISQSLVSHQLRILKMEGLIKSHREGKKIFYSLDDEHVVDILKKSLKHIIHKSKEGIL